MGIDVLFEGQNFSRLLEGLWLTAKISFISAFFSLIFGVIVGIAMLSRKRTLRWICRFYLELVRTMPLLVLLFIGYFGLAKWFHVQWNNVQVCIMVFVFWGAAEMGDLVRGAFSSIEKHQIESAYALGLRRAQVIRYIALPQSIRRITPGAINLFTRMIKTSSLAMLIGVLEVIKVGQQVIETALLSSHNTALWIYGVIMVLYFIICYPLTQLSYFLEKRFAHEDGL
ncbi:amino acid ABC transporter permease [Pasteurellaceae bacterium HPA106]|uniref:amino acid ABC transporter permease n=1 Tax=Spirabiliibacterium pneumoniae TaxID=221400 RepID=UPI001AACACE3|nr:amino acid ABC transporter permease [Spirabiliibacterium pneumoniae]MBE2895681.1 amino acid ABC transporter permease [Spirabiliibacterium pneumoniae]